MTTCLILLIHVYKYLVLTLKCWKLIYDWTIMNRLYWTHLMCWSGTPRQDVMTNRHGIFMTRYVAEATRKRNLLDCGNQLSPTLWKMGTQLGGWMSRNRALSFLKTPKFQKNAASVLMILRQMWKNMIQCSICHAKFHACHEHAKERKIKKDGI